jgi:hypothetical protein
MRSSLSAAPSACAAGLDAARQRLASLSLPELEQRAGLLHRQDDKYLFTEQAAADLLDALSQRYQVLEIDGARSFAYDSIYLDTPDLRVYRDHAQGRRLRWKARTRRYGDGPSCFREIKLKGSAGSTVKLREACPVREHGWAGPAFHRFLDRSLREHYGFGLTGHLTASLSVRYERTTLVSVDGVERLTLDRELTFVDAAGRSTGRLRPGLVLAEVKRPGGRGAADRVLASRGVRPASLSKYGIGVALSRPDLRHAELRAVLRASFTADVAGPTVRAA